MTIAITFALSFIAGMIFFLLFFSGAEFSYSTTETTTEGHLPEDSRELRDLHINSLIKQAKRDLNTLHTELDEVNSIIEKSHPLAQPQHQETKERILRDIANIQKFIESLETNR